MSNQSQQATVIGEIETEAKIKLDKGDVIAFLVEQEIGLLKEERSKLEATKSDLELMVRATNKDLCTLVEAEGKKLYAKKAKVLIDAIESLANEALSNYSKDWTLIATPATALANRNPDEIKVKIHGLPLNVAGLWNMPVKITPSIRENFAVCLTACDELTALNVRAEEVCAMLNDTRSLERKLRASLVGHVLGGMGEEGKHLLESFKKLRSSGSLNMLTDKKPSKKRGR